MESVRVQCSQLIALPKKSKEQVRTPEKSE
jgi:hypothetical protein